MALSTIVPKDSIGLLIRDITAQEGDYLRHEHLIQESVHHAGNPITVMSMVIERTFVGHDDAQRRLKARTRVQAIAAAQAILGTSSAADIADAARRTLQGFEESGDRIRISGPLAIFSQKQTQGLSLALYELATNALMHGALNTDEGSSSWTGRFPSSRVRHWTCGSAVAPTFRSHPPRGSVQSCFRK